MSQDSINLPPRTAPHDGTKPDFSGVPSQALDAVRMRLAQLTHSLRKIKDELSKANLPQWYSLQSQLNVTLSQFSSVTSTLQHFQDTLDTTVVYPLTKFPTTSHENLLTTLLRKKYAPEIDEWIKSTKEASGLNAESITQQEIDRIHQNDKEITTWALEIFAKEFDDHNFKGFQTKRESTSDSDSEQIYVPSSSRYKPKTTFEVEDILNFTYKGEHKSLEVKK
ncbi:hypothetical protein KAFR_0I00820 [Kazachstania africana CBS 2517]|uniref:Mediator of RNA polymerase II transcription subunit 8 n=1 Tax=Kazachstania africana (strain ATCC 22294 / BCRC 22015 / CBS 2517 / CECT 1963 / NBRC 1671 / NRRL Y-8276) TaxID=1071382 RepID=H2AZR3_KAZAF|nr:hypothetical protein KAFR_0I00820 [Kazachstania africana CBS 2517]CCF59863.1 hypothetical protein KAFR_0I00820 [Kazachstania africana CBS 2517]